MVDICNIKLFKIKVFIVNMFDQDKIKSTKVS